MTFLRIVITLHFLPGTPPPKGGHDTGAARAGAARPRAGRIGVLARASFLASGDECGIAYPPDEIVPRIRALCRARDLLLSERASTRK